MPLEDALTLTAVKTHTDSAAASSTAILTAVETHKHTAPLPQCGSRWLSTDTETATLR